MPKYLTIIDCECVERDTNDDRIDELMEQLKASVKVTCKHPLSERHIRVCSTTDTNEWYESHYCEACDKSWEVWLDGGAA